MRQRVAPAGQHRVEPLVAGEIPPEESVDVGRPDVALAVLGELGLVGGPAGLGAPAGTTDVVAGVVPGGDLPAVGRPLRVEVVVVRAVYLDPVEPCGALGGRGGGEGEGLPADLAVAGPPDHGHGRLRDLVRRHVLGHDVVGGGERHDRPDLDAGGQLGLVAVGRLPCDARAAARVAQGADPVQVDVVPEVDAPRLARGRVAERADETTAPGGVELLPQGEVLVDQVGPGGGVVVAPHR